MIRVCPHSDTACIHGMGCTFSCATDAYDGTKLPLSSGAPPISPSAASAELLPPDEPNTSSLLARVAELEGALTFYRDAWEWFPLDGEQPNAVDVGSPPTAYDCEPNSLLLQDKGERARSALIGEE